jgi:integrase/recombinase XerD
MNLAVITWSVERQHCLQDQLTGFWAADTWDMSKCPLVTDAAKALPILHFNCIAPSLNAELKYACWQKFEQRQWSVQASNGYAKRICYIIAWLNRVSPRIASLMEKPILEWELSLRSYLHEIGPWKGGSSSQLNSEQETRKYIADDPRISVFRSIYKAVADFYDSRTEYERDIWDVRKLRLSYNLSGYGYKINFTRITQPWLNLAAKRFIRYALATHSVSDCRSKVYAIISFSEFIKQQHPHIPPTEVNRSVILDFISYLASSNLSTQTRSHHLINIRMFLELCSREQWAAFPDKQLIYDDDIPKPGKGEPRFIPEDILDQLNCHIDALPPAIMRMVLILQECGMRISELCTIAFDCLHPDADGDLWLRTYQGKMKKEHSVPVLPEVVSVIREQQDDIRRTWGDEMPYLFPDSKGRPLKQQMFARAINRLAHDKGIRDTSGRLFRFQSHQFRHTVGTRMINRGYPHHIVQRYLGHESPEMTSRYARLHDETLKREFAKFASTQVDITGKTGDNVVAQFDSVDLQWFKKNLHAQALPNGTCWLPATKGRCPHANACLTCTHFRTDICFLPQHKAHLEETRRLLAKARTNGWERQIEMNEQVEHNLERIIIKLEQVNT